MREIYPVLEGAESFYLEGNEVGLLITHGFLGTPQSVRYLGEAFGKLGYSVFAPRLKGHGTHYKDMEKTTHMDWYAEMEKGYLFLRERCSTVYVVGQSMGGALALWLGKKYPDINGLVLINAALKVPAYDYLIGKLSPQYIPEGEPDIKRSGVEEITYGKVSIRSIHELQEAMAKTSAILPAIKNPVLCFKSIEDHVVPAECTDYIADQIGSEQKEILPLYNSYHVASMDFDQDKIIEKTHKFVQNMRIEVYA
ncbi:alpha/beta hydrolase [Cytobacillus sp. NCCP-133]|uniref:alpha/beta hydrolase n=1 Tax=Cytobacillus sp. NCCP-133 TaxID=766848 RepID=UPI0022320F0F|nr:alpha/beta fold hydrolase [Cytobacillus sp. NCCP-133]GLB60097.1 esterase [Cytobacillus sp. NCCP-133]